MSSRIASATLVAHLFCLTLMSADVAGTWKLDLSKPTLKAEYASDIVKIEEADNLTYRFTYDVVLKVGQESHGETVRTF
jgi:hypothetical protein